MKKIKIFIISLVTVLAITGGVKIFSNKNLKEPVESKGQEENKQKLESKDKETDKETTVEDDIEEEEKDQEKTGISLDHNSKPTTNGVSNKNPSSSSGNTKPGEEKLEDLIIKNDMITDGTYNIANKKYNTLTIASDIKSNTKIILDSVEVNEGLTIENPGKYQLDIVNSTITNMLVVDKTQNNFFSLFRSVMKNSINKSLEGATINLDGSNIDSISINSNVQINGTNNVTNIEVNDCSEVVLNVPSQNVLLNTTGLVAINQNIDKLINNNKSTIIVNAKVSTLTNNESSMIRINGGNKIDTFNNQGENTVVAGSGTITNANINASNTRIYTDVANKQVSENVDYLLIRKEPDIKIVEAKSTSQGKVTFTLSKEAKLTLNDISVICNAGKNITLYNISTKDNKTYTVTTSYYKNDSYALYITLPNGNIISKDFDTDYANPTIENVVIERNSNTQATLKLYGLDEGGHIYYILEDATTKTNIDVETIKRNGKSASVKVGFNSISLTDLEQGKAYNLYYILEGFFENTSKVNGPINITSEVKEQTSSKYEVIYAKEEISNRFVFRLNRIPEKELTLEDFEIDCPSDSSLTIKDATFYVSPDLLTYIIVIPNNYGHKDNSYSVKIKISETETIEKEFVTHLNPPVITGAVDNVVRTSETTAEFKFNSDEPGKVYYGVYDWNGGIYDYNSTTPFASDVITGKIECKTQELYAGANTINIDLNGIEVTNNTRIWALFVDNAGNYRLGFVDHYKIPEYKEITPEPVTTLEIVDFEYSKSSFRLTFNEEIYEVGQNDIKLSVVKGGSLSSKIMYMIDNSVAKKLTIQIPDPMSQLTPGEYELALNLTDKNGKNVTLVEKIEIK